MFRFLRIAVLLYVLAFVAVGTLVTANESTDWDRPLRVQVFALPGDQSAAVSAELAALGSDDYAAIETFLATEAARYGLGLERPFRIVVDAETQPDVPAVPPEPTTWAILLWSLRMRWLVTKLHWQSDARTPDITVFAVYHDDEANVTLDRSTALRKGLIAYANLFADSELRGSNAIVVAHELLHTLGATDKYSAATNLPLFPDGYAAPDARPRYPQTHAEIMAGRRALTSRTAELPASLREVVVGPLTAREIGWPSP